MSHLQKQPAAGGVREMLTIALPMMISNASETVMTVTDRYFLSQLGPEHMAAAMGGGVFAFTMMCFFMGLTGYATAMVAQHIGAGRPERCFTVVFQALLIVWLAYPLLLLLKPLGPQVFAFAGISPLQVEQQNIYFNTLMYGSILALTRSVLCTFFSGLGKTRVIMTTTIITMVVNILANYILIFGHLGFEPMGIRGAALGTIIGSASGVAILLWAIIRSAHIREFPLLPSIGFDGELLKKLLRFGYPAGIEMLFNLIGFSTMVMILHGHSSITATAATVMFNWEMLAFLPLFGVEIAVISLVGRYVGAKEYDIAHRSTISGLKVVMIYASGISLCFALFPTQLAELFRSTENGALFDQALPMAASFLRVVSLFIFAQSLLFVFTGALRGAGDTFWPMIISVSAHWIAAIGLYISINMLGISPPHSWGILALIFFLIGSLNFWRYRSGSWKRIDVLGSES